MKNFDFVWDLNQDELNHLTEIVRSRRAELTRHAKTEFSVGDLVRFKGRKSGEWAGILEGKVIKRNPKRAKVSVKSRWGRTSSWTVPYSMLTKVETENA